MFKRLMLDETTAIVTFIAFVVAATIFITFVWRAIRMNRKQVEHFEDLPFKTPTPASVALRGSAGTDGEKHMSRSSRSGLHNSKTDESR